MAGSRTLPLLAAVLLAAVAYASAEESTPTILTPPADTPLGSYEVADGPSAEDAVGDADDAASAGSPIGTTMTEPRPEPTTPSGTAGTTTSDTPTSGSSSLVVGLLGFVAVVAAGSFAF